MLLRHSLIYLFGRGIPGILGFITIVVYTRLLSPADYGLYALVMTAAILVNAVIYQWLNGSLLRFLPQYRDDPANLLAALLGGFLLVSLLAGLVGLALIPLRDTAEWRRLILFGIGLVWVQAWFTLNLELARSRLLPIRYGIMSGLRTCIALGLGTLLILSGFGAYGALLGLIAGYLAPGVAISWRQWREAGWRGLDRGLVAKLLAYGLPLTASYSLNAVITSTDRFMLAGMIDESATGLYVAGQGLPQQTVGVFMLMVNLAAYPLVVHALEGRGEPAARVQLRNNALLLLGAGLPVACLFVFESPAIAAVFLGEDFRGAAARIIPWVATAALLGGLRAYYFDLAFYLGRRTSLQAVVMLSAALVNIILNYRLIPAFGLAGAAYASLAAHGLGLFFSAILGRRVFTLPLIAADAGKLALATAAMAAVLYLLPPAAGIAGLALAIVTSGAAFMSTAFALDAGGVRDAAWRLLGQRVYRQRFFTR